MIAADGETEAEVLMGVIIGSIHTTIQGKPLMLQITMSGLISGQMMNTFLPA